jgi:two-component system cell cycle sensor histidine kinase/response regulator CckA
MLFLTSASMPEMPSKGKGTGMGLSSAFGAVKQHGGGLFVESIPGRGSTFQIFLPFSPEDSIEKKSKNSEITYEDVGTAKILLIDDDKPIRDLVIEFLETLGYQVHAEADGNSGLNYFRENHSEINLVIMDMIMPEMGGVELFSEIKEIQPDIRILLSSGYGSQKGSILNLIQQGTPFLQKPISLKELSDAVAKILQEKK